MTPISQLIYSSLLRPRLLLSSYIIKLCWDRNNLKHDAGPDSAALLPPDRTAGNICFTQNKHHISSIRVACGAAALHKNSSVGFGFVGINFLFFFFLYGWFLVPVRILVYLYLVVFQLCFLELLARLWTVGVV